MHFRAEWFPLPVMHAAFACAPTWCPQTASHPFRGPRTYCNVSVIPCRLRIEPSGAVTRAVSLRGCTGIDGGGLVSLAGSDVLERIDLRVQRTVTPGPLGLAEDTVVGILTTMLKPTHALQMIQVRRPRHDRNFWNSLSPALRFLMKTLHDAMRDRVIQAQTRCGFCKNVLADILDANDLQMLGHSFCSGGCGRHSCCVAAESKCAQVLHCIECDASYCDECRIVIDCEICNKSFCVDCKLSSWCEICNKFFCVDCKMSTWCEICNKFFCIDCKMSTYCEICEKFFCVDCKMSSYCEICNKFFCVDCKHGMLCEDCNSPFCADCGDWCSRCEVDVCKGCAGDHVLWHRRNDVY